MLLIYMVNIMLILWSLVVFNQVQRVFAEVKQVRSEIKEFEAELVKIASQRKYRRY